MQKLARALGALLASALVSAGFVVTTPAAAQAGSAAPPPRAARIGQLTGSVPVLSGPGTIGNPLTVALPTWSLTGVSSSVQWLSNGSPIPGATGVTFVPGLEDVGDTISAAVTGTLGPLTLTLRSAGITILEPDSGVPEMITAPELTGVPVVGELLTVVGPVFDMLGVATAYQWLRGGVPIPGETGDTYVAGLEDVGHEIAVRVTSTFLGLPVLSTVTNVLPISAGGGRAISATAAPSVTAEAGLPKVGTSLKTSQPGWSEDGVATRYQWLRNGVAINGAVADRYTLTPADLEAAVSVRATGEKSDFTSGVVTSNAVTVMVGDAIRQTRQPTVSGRHKAGQLLTVDPGTWGAGAAPLFTYQWQRDGRAIPGAVAQTYQVVPADAGKAISVTVSATRAGYRPGTFRTSGVTVAKLASTLTATLAKKQVKEGQRATLTLLLEAAGVDKPTGVVTVTEGKKVLEKVTVKKGRATLKLGKLKPGVHKLKAVFAGTSSIAGASSKALKLTVRK